MILIISYPTCQLFILLTKLNNYQLIEESKRLFDKPIEKCGFVNCAVTFGVVFEKAFYVLVDINAYEYHNNKSAWNAL